MSDSRLAELVSELAGASYAADVTKRLWDALPPEQLAELSADVHRRALAASAGFSDWEVKREVEEHLAGEAKRVAAAWVEGHRAEFEGRVRALVAERWETTAMAAVTEALRGVTAKVKQGVADKLREWTL